MVEGLFVTVKPLCRYCYYQQHHNPIYKQLGWLYGGYPVAQHVLSQQPQYHGNDCGGVLTLSCELSTLVY